MKIAFLIFSCLVLSIAQSQPQAEARFHAENGEANQSCYTLELSQNSTQPLLLSGQNYRIFYSSASLELDDASLGLRLDSELYTLKLVQHQNHVDGSHIGVLPFDQDLGFINVSMILNGTNTRGDFIPPSGTSIPIVSMCFDIIDSSVAQDIVLARSELTSEYGRAYVELSYVDDKGTIQNLPIVSEGDIHIPGK